MSQATATTPIQTRRTGDQISIRGDYQYRVYRRGWAPQRFWHHAKLVEAERWLDPQPGDVILDAGCGSGLLAARLADRPGTHVIGIDGNEDAIQFARDRFRSPNLEFRLGLVDALELPDGCADKIAFLEVIEHIHEHQAAAVLLTFHRLLQPGGRLVISTPNLASLWPVIEWTLDRLRLTPTMDGEQHVQLYTAGRLNSLAERAGFHRLAHRTINAVAPWLAMASWRLAKVVHCLEVRRATPFGSLLLDTFVKSA